MQESSDAVEDVASCEKPAEHLSIAAMNPLAAKFERVFPTNPGDGVGYLEDVFVNVFRQPLRITERREPGDVNVGKTGRVWISRAVGIGNAKLLGNIFSEIEGQSVYRVAKISAMKVVEQLRRKSMGIA